MTLPTSTKVQSGPSIQRPEFDDRKVDESIPSALQAISAIQPAAHSLSPEKTGPIPDKETSQKAEELFLETTRPFTPQLRTKMVEESARALRALYIDEAKAEEMASCILENLKSGKYDSYDRQFPFIRRLEADLLSICQDRHFEIRHTLNPIPLYDWDRELQDPKTENLSPLQLQYKEKCDAKEKEDLREINFGVGSVEIRENNIGYLKLTGFVGPDFAETFQKIDEAMTVVKDASALVVDLRENQGGCPETVARLASYLFDEKTLLNRIYQRSTNEWTDFYAEPDKVSFRFGQGKPVYILVGKGTMSAAEEFAYDLQACKRGLVIGQKTWGGAHPIRNFVIDDHFYLAIPYKKAENPITRKNWERTGVTPDLSSEDAFKEAISTLAGRA